MKAAEVSDEVEVTDSRNVRGKSISSSTQTEDSREMNRHQLLKHTGMQTCLFAICVIEHAVHDVLSQFGFIRVGSSAHPGVNDALIVCALKWYLQKT